MPNYTVFVVERQWQIEPLTSYHLLNVCYFVYARGSDDAELSVCDAIVICR